MRNRVVFFIILNLAVISLSGRSQLGDLTLDLNKRHISVAEFFSGTEITASGRMPSGCDVVVQLASPGASRRFRLKGKRGPFWLGIGTVKLENVPWTVVVRSTGPLPGMLPEAELERLWIGRLGTLKRIKVSGRNGGGLYVAELMRLEEKAGLYDFSGGGVELKRGGFYPCSFRLPAAIPPANYAVEAFAVKNHRAIRKVRAVFAVERSGMPSMLNTESKKHPVSYGASAVLMAVLVGLLAGFLHGRRRQIKTVEPG